MRTKEIIINYNQELNENIQKRIKDPDFIKNINKKMTEGKMLTNCESVIARIKVLRSEI